MPKDYMTLEQFRIDYNNIVSNTNTLDYKMKELETYLTFHRERLPLFYTSNLIQEGYTLHPSLINTESFLYNDRYYSDLVDLDCTQELFIDPKLAIGYTWLFCNDRTSGRPIPHRLASILLASVNNLPKVFAAKAGEYFEFIEGNHRIYAAFLLNRLVGIDCDSEYTSIKHFER